MRYYKVVITDQSGKEVFFNSLGKNQRLTSLLPNGLFNAGALNVEFDIPIAQYHIPAGNAYMRVWGLGLQDIGNAFNLNPITTNEKVTDQHQIEIYGGMSKGLPLANPAQAGLLLKGSIQQAFGNWVGVEQSVDLLFAPYTGNSDQPINLVLNWLQNTSLDQPLRQTLQTAFPDATVEININPRLVQNHDEPGFYGSLTQLATYLNDLSKRIIKDQGYPGVSISYNGATLRVFDATKDNPPVDIAFVDMIGQPTWISPFTVQFRFVLRGDLDIDSIINIPSSLATNTAAAQPGLTGNPSNKLVFSGKYRIIRLHHYGNFRQPSSESWATVVDALPENTAAA